MNVRRESLLMNVLIPLIAVGGLFALGFVGAAAGLGWLFGVVFPYLAVHALFSRGYSLSRDELGGNAGSVSCTHHVWTTEVPPVDKTAETG